MKKALILSCLLGLNISTAGTSYSYDLMEYFPMSPGSTWEYNVTGRTSHYTYTWQERYVHGAYETVNGFETVSRSYYDSDYASMTLIDDHDFFAYDNDFLYLVASKQAGNPSWNDDPLGYYINNPPISLKRNLNIGESWTSSTTEKGPLGNTSFISFTFTLMGIEDVVVPAGEFSDCLKLRLISSEYPDETEYLWWAKGVGEVKFFDYESDETVTGELTSYYLPNDSSTLTLSNSEKLENFVTRFYEECLYRSPDQEGLDGWVNALQNGIITAEKLAEGFIFSKEFTSLNTTNEDFTTILYQVFMGRQPDISGFNGWVNALYGGMSRSTIFEAFVNSGEFANICLDYGISASGTGFSVEQFVTRFYEECLDRSPDQEGLSGWTNALLAGTLTGADLAEAFIFSQEFIDSNQSNEEFLTILYLAFFNRQPDSAGYNGWLNAIYSGMSRANILAGFINSSEFEDLCSQYGISPNEDYSISGTWYGNWYSIYNDSGQLTIRLDQSESSLSGTLDVTNTDCGNVYNIPFTGTLENDLVNIYATHNCDGDTASLHYTSGIISNDKLNINGDYTLYVNGDWYDSGTFNVNR